MMAEPVEHFGTIDFNIYMPGAEATGAPIQMDTVGTTVLIEEMDPVIDQIWLDLTTFIAAHGIDDEGEFEVVVTDAGVHNIASGTRYFLTPTGGNPPTWENHDGSVSDLVGDLAPWHIFVYPSDDEYWPGVMKMFVNAIEGREVEVIFPTQNGDVILEFDIVLLPIEPVTIPNLNGIDFFVMAGTLAYGTPVIVAEEASRIVIPRDGTSAIFGNFADFFVDHNIPIAAGTAFDVTVTPGASGTRHVLFPVTPPGETTPSGWTDGDETKPLADWDAFNLFWYLPSSPEWAESLKLNLGVNFPEGRSVELTFTCAFGGLINLVFNIDIAPPPTTIDVDDLNDIEFFVMEPNANYGDPVAVAQDSSTIVIPRDGTTHIFGDFANFFDEYNIPIVAGTQFTVTVTPGAGEDSTTGTRYVLFPVTPPGETTPSGWTNGDDTDVLAEWGAFHLLWYLPGSPEWAETLKFNLNANFPETGRNVVLAFTCEKGGIINLS
jgi:hypothetical protein